jgi:hypothetical protein
MTPAMQKIRDLLIYGLQADTLGKKHHYIDEAITLLSTIENPEHEAMTGAKQCVTQIEAGEDRPDVSDLEFALDWWGNLHYEDGCKFAQEILLQHRTTLQQALRSSGQGWRSISEMPDGKSFLVAERIMMGDGYFEPEIIYRNGMYYFRKDRTKSNLSAMAIFREIPPPPKEAT